jgi:tetraacyldisaccharide 4'-kinase
LKLLRILLFPVVPFYFLVTWLRNKLFDWDVYESKSYDFPVICVGNLSVGGTGKSPMIEYLIRLLKDDYRLATLSRGYKRTSKGFQIADENTTVELLGDEPFQFHQKFKDIIVSVDANRQEGISNLIQLRTAPEVVLLDDAYQHRKVKAGFYIMLTTYDNLYTNDIVLPTGNLREPRAGAKRANIIIVTKCPETLTEVEQEHIISKIKPLNNQKVFFSKIDYSNTILSEGKSLELLSLKEKPFTLVTGIANPKPLLDYLRQLNLKFEHLNFKDHHAFSDSEIEMLKSKSLILTTEKDYTRLEHHLNDNLYYLPIESKIENSEEFDSLLLEYVKTAIKQK